MAANAQPIFVGTVRNHSCSIITGYTTADGANSTLLYQADATNGSRIHAISAVFSGTISTQSVVRLWLYTPTTYSLISEQQLPIYTQAAGVPAPAVSLLDYANQPYLDPADRYITLDAGDALYVSLYTTIETHMHVTAFGGDF